MPINLGTLYYVVVALGKFKYSITKHIHKLEPYRHVICRNECDQCCVQTDQLIRISHIRFLDYNCHTALCHKCDRIYGRQLKIWIDQQYWNYIPMECVGINKYFYVNIKRSVGQIEEWQIIPRSYVILKHCHEYGYDIPYLPVFTPDPDGYGAQMKKNVPLSAIIDLNPHMKWLSFTDINLTNNLSAAQYDHWCRAWNRNVKDYKTIRYCSLLSTKNVTRLPSDVWKVIFSLL